MMKSNVCRLLVNSFKSYIAFSLSKEAFLCAFYLSRNLRFQKSRYLIGAALKYNPHRRYIPIATLTPVASFYSLILDLYKIYGDWKSDSKIHITHLICKVQIKDPTKSILGIEISIDSHHFSGLTILTSDMDPENFRSISQRLAIYRTICKMAPNAGL